MAERGARFAARATRRSRSLCPPGCHGDGGGAQELQEHVARGRPQARTRAARAGEADPSRGPACRGAAPAAAAGTGGAAVGAHRGGRGGARRGGKLKSPAGGFDVCHTKDEKSSVRVVGGLQVEGAHEEPRSFHEQAYPARNYTSQRKHYDFA